MLDMQRIARDQQGTQILQKQIKNNYSKICHEHAGWVHTESKYGILLGIYGNSSESSLFVNKTLLR